jgi:hypothetical protein
MRFEVILSVAVGAWTALLLLVVALCAAAKRSDEAMDTALASATAAGREAEVTRPPSSERPLRTLSLGSAAALLDVNPETLLAWEARYGFPTSSPSEPRYNQSEVLALRDGLDEGLSIASAVSRARETKRRRRAVATEVLDHRDGGLAS